MLTSEQQTWIENWPQDLVGLSFRQKGIPLSAGSVRYLISANLGYAGKLSSGEEFRTVLEWVDKEIADFPQGAFVRLGSRSPKDSAVALITELKAVDSQGVNTILCAGSRRLVQDLRECWRMSYVPWLFLREWVKIEPQSEFRCFVNNGKLVGLSPYFANMDETAQSTAALRESIHSIKEIIAKVIMAYKAPCFVADLAVDRKWPNGAVLVEINPWGPPTDPGLYDWSERFIGDFRFLSRQRRVCTFDIESIT